MQRAQQRVTHHTQTGAHTVSCSFSRHSLSSDATASTLPVRLRCRLQRKKLRSSRGRSGAADEHIDSNPDCATIIADTISSPTDSVPCEELARNESVPRNPHTLHALPSQKGQKPH